MSNRKFEIDFGILKSTEKLNNEQFGTLLRALISYAKDGTETEFDDLAMSLAFDAQKVMIDNKKAEYNDKCEKNRQNVMKRWQKNSDTTVYDRIPSYEKNTTVSPNSFNNSNSIYINNINKDIQTTSYKKEKNTIINDSKKEKVSLKSKQILPHRQAMLTHIHFNLKKISIYLPSLTRFGVHTLEKLVKSKQRKLGLKNSTV